MRIYDFAIVNCQKHNMIKTNDALQVLINALNFDNPAAKEISIGLFRLYQFCQDQMRKRKYEIVQKVLTELKESEKEVVDAETLIEPSAQIVVEEIIPQLVEYLIYQCVLESNASEHSARMTAMRNASDNARDRVVELTLDYNKARQQQITSEVCEISSAKEVLG